MGSLPLAKYGARHRPPGGPAPTNLLALVLLAAVFGAVIVRQVTDRGPGVWALFVAGAFATVAFGVLPLSGAEAALAVSAPVLVFLFALFLFAGALERAGALDHIARWLLGRARRSEDLAFVLFLGFGVASAFLVNDALVLIGVPLLVAVARRLRVDARPLLLVLAISVTVGSALTPFGNPQNLLVSVDSGLRDPVTTFLRYLLLPTAVNLLVGAWYLRRRFAARLRTSAADFDRLRAAAPPLFPEGGWRRRLIEHPVLWVFPATMTVLVTLDVTAALTNGPVVPVWETASAGAVVLLLASPGRTRIVERVDWSILLLFAGLFVVVGGAVSGGVVGGFESYVPVPGPSHPIPGILAIVGSSVVGPQFVSNVPWVALEIPILSGVGYGGGTPVAWVALAAASTLAGNVTLLGAASNLIVVDLADRSGFTIRLGEFVREALPVAAMTLAVLVACLLVGL